MRRGALIKQCRRREVEYEFVLLNDLLLYGTAVAGGGDASGAAAAGACSDADTGQSMAIKTQLIRQE